MQEMLNRRRVSLVAAIPIVASAAATALAFDGCSDDPAQPELRSLERNRATWEAHELNSYEYDFRRNCFCLPEAVRPVVIRVVDGAVAEVTFADTGEPVPEGSVDRYPTIDELFEEIADAIERDADEITATYHPDLGHPTEAFIDYDVRVADEEMGFSASDLRPLSGGD